ncbi:MAG: DUF3520 domain-containing protein [Pseudomonadales bacterium]|nr:DUF3520 domain-containing protein [Pseudomonadales bacterium]
MKHNESSIQPLLIRGLQASYQLILCIGLITLMLVACSSPTERNVGRIEQPPEPKESRPSGQSTIEVDNNVSNQPNVAVNPIPVPNQAIQVTEEAEILSGIVSADASTSRVRTTSAPASAGVQVARQELLVSPGHNYGRRDADGIYYHPGSQIDRENYLELVENAVKRVAADPVSTFSIDVDTAGYSNIRRMLSREGRLPPHDAVRLEEMINYFDYRYPTPTSVEQPINIYTETMAAPWNADNQLLMVGMQGFEPESTELPNANLVFLVDVSGSMQSPDKLGLVKRSLQLLVNQMDEDDRIALVVYAGAAGMVLDSTSGAEKSKIINALESLHAGGSTNGAAGIQLAYRIAEENIIDGGINRVIIASDGDLNVGMTDIDELKELISKKRENGIALTTLGYGTGNYNYSLMEQLADTGNGNAAYIDTLSEAQKVLVEEMQSTLLTIAKDVKIQIEFNPNIVAEYRLIGYENRLLNREDFRNDKVDAGEVGAGHTVTALYEISLKGSQGALIPDLRYGNNGGEEVNFGDELAYVNVRFKMPEESSSTEFGQAVTFEDVSESSVDATENMRFAAAVAGFGQLLRGGKYTNDWNYDDLLQLARESRGVDNHGYRSEMVKLVELAKVL